MKYDNPLLNKLETKLLSVYQTVKWETKGTTNVSKQPSMASPRFANEMHTALSETNNNYAVWFINLFLLSSDSDNTQIILEC